MRTAPVSSDADAAPLCVRWGPSSHGLANKLARAIWELVWLFLFRPSPRPFHRWRVLLLRLFGAKIATGVQVFSSTRIWAPWNLTMDEFSTLAGDVDCYCVAAVRLGAHATVSQYAMLCTATHDVSDPHMRLVTAPIHIADQAWVCARAFVAPGVTVGQGAIVGAMAVATKDVPAWTIVAGNPAKELRKRVLRPPTARVEDKDTPKWESGGP
jgi:putative colanic acid biosynthesis acetyltransferase WcaF